ncbi:MAG TPA: efflux RND transporter permease subunit [Burkholderiales bacterium]
MDAPPVVTARPARTPRRFAQWPARHPAAASVLLLVVAVLGSVLAARVPVERAASVHEFALHIDAVLDGFDAAFIDAAVTQPLERILEAADVRAREARSVPGRARITLYFDSPEARDAAIGEIERRIIAALPELPSGMARPIVTPSAPAQPPAIVYAVAAPAISPEVLDWVRHILLEPLRELDAVSAVALEGSPVREIRIEPDSRRLAALGLGFEDVIESLRGNEQIRARRRAKGETTALPAEAQAIAARAVRLPSGEPIPLGEIARVTVEARPQAMPLRIGGAPALRAVVRARSGVEAQQVAERARAHLAWLRANGVVPDGVVVRVLHDEQQAARAWRNRAAGHLLWLGVALLGLAAAAMGRRSVIVGALAIAVWLPAALASLWGFGVVLDRAAAAGIVLALVPFAAASIVRGSGGAWAAVAGAALFCLGAGWALEIGARGAMAFNLALAAGALVRWLMLPWARGEPNAVRRAKSRPARLIVALLPLLAACAAAVYAAHAIIQPSGQQGDWRLRLYGSDATRLASIADATLPAVHAIGHVDDVRASHEPEEQWRLHVDAARLDGAGLTTAEVGRAFAVATTGLVVGEAASADEVLPLRLQLPAGAAGDSFERLLLRGERQRRPALYMRDVGLVERVEEPRERLRLNGLPAVDITARWGSAGTRTRLAALCGRLELPAGYGAECRIVERAAGLEGAGADPHEAD